MQEERKRTNKQTCLLSESFVCDMNGLNSFFCVMVTFFRLIIINFQNDEYGIGSKHDCIGQSLPNTPTSKSNSFNTYSSMMQKPHTNFYTNENESKQGPYSSEDARSRLPWSIDKNNNNGIYHVPAAYSTAPPSMMGYGEAIIQAQTNYEYDPYRSSSQYDNFFTAPASVQKSQKLSNMQNLDKHLVDPYNDFSRQMDPYYTPATPSSTKPTYTNYHTPPQQLPGTPLNISQLNLTSNELYNADINYMNNYLKSLPDYNLLANSNTGAAANQNTTNIVAGESDNHNFNYTGSYFNTATPQMQYPLSKSSSFQSFNTVKPQLYQHHPTPYENVLPGKGISRSTSSHAIPHHHHIQPPLHQFIGSQQQHSVHAITPSEVPIIGWNDKNIGGYLQNNMSNVGIGGEGLCTRPPTAGASKPSISEFWKENLNSSTKQPKVGWNYNKIMSKTKDELQNTINRYKNNIANLNNSLMVRSNDAMTDDNPFKLRKNYSYTNVDTHLREQLKNEHAYELMYLNNRQEKPPQYDNGPTQFYTHANSAFTPVGDFNPITSSSSNYSLNSFYSPVQPADLSYTSTNTTPPPPPGFKSLMKSMSNASVSSYLNSNPVPFGYHLQKSSSKVSHIPVPTKTNPLSKSNSNSTIMQLPSVNLTELSSYLPHNLSKSSSSSCIYAKTLSQPSHLRKTNDIFSPYKGFDVSEANKNVSKNTELMRNEIRKKPAISLKPSNSFSGGVRPSVIFQKPTVNFERPKASTPIAKCITDTSNKISNNIPPNENLPAASFAGERLYGRYENDPRSYETIDYSIKSDPGYSNSSGYVIHERPPLIRDTNCLVNIEDNIGRSIADIYDVGNNYNHIYGSSPSKKPNFDYKSNLNPEAKNFTPLSKSTTVKYIPFNYEKCKAEIKSPPESSYLSSPHLVRKIMRSNTINFNTTNNLSSNQQQYGEQNMHALTKIPSFTAMKHEKFNPLGNVSLSLENAVPQTSAKELQAQRIHLQQQQQAAEHRDSNNNNTSFNKPDAYLKNYQEDILRQFDPYFNASTAVNDTNSAAAFNNNNNSSNVVMLNDNIPSCSNSGGGHENISVKNMTHDLDSINANVSVASRLSNNSNNNNQHNKPKAIRHASSTDLFLDCDDEEVDNESDLLDDADLDADDEDEGAAGVSTTESVSEYLQSCGYPFKKSKKYSHQFSQSNSIDGSKLKISGTDDSTCCTPASAPPVVVVDEVQILFSFLKAKWNLDMLA